MSKMYYRYGAMNSGKSTALLQVAHNYEEQGMNIMLIKPFVDTKGGAKVVSRLGAERQVHCLIGPETRLNELCNDKSKDCIHAILVDEAQFLTKEQVDDLYFIVKIHDIPVIAFGLRCDFMMEGFPGATRFLQIADDIEELKTICKCGNKATQNMRFINGKHVFEGEQVCIDDQSNVSYDAVCGKCYVSERLYDQAIKDINRIKDTVDKEMADKKAMRLT